MNFVLLSFTAYLGIQLSQVDERRTSTTNLTNPQTKMSTIEENLACFKASANEKGIEEPLADHTAPQDQVGEALGFRRISLPLLSDLFQVCILRWEYVPEMLLLSGFRIFEPPLQTIRNGARQQRLVLSRFAQRPAGAMVC